MRKSFIGCAAALLASVACAATNVVTNVTAATILKCVPTTTVLSNLVNIGAGSPTNRLLWTSVTNITSRKRDLDDLRVYRRMNDCWVWTDWMNPMEPDARPAPADFLAFANSPGSTPIYFKNDGWFGGTQFWPNGKRKYMKDPGPGGLGKETDLNFAFTAYDETGTNELFRFGAHAHRENPTNETFVSWSDRPVNEFVRVATTDMVDWNLEGKTGTNDFIAATNDLWKAKFEKEDVIQFEGGRRDKVMSQDAVTFYTDSSVEDATKDLFSKKDFNVTKVDVDGEVVTFTRTVPVDEVGSAVWTGRLFADAKLDPASTNDIAHGRLIDAEGNEAVCAKSIAHWCGDLTGSLVYLCNCYSGYDDILAKAFLAKGARTVIAHSSVTQSNYGDAVMYAFCSRLAETNSAGVRYTAAEALDWATAKYGHSDRELYPVMPGSRPLLYGDQDYRLPAATPTSVATVQPFYWESKEQHGDDTIPLPAGVANNAEIPGKAAGVLAAISNVTYSYSMKRVNQTDSDRIDPTVLGSIGQNTIALFQGHGTHVPYAVEETVAFTNKASGGGMRIYPKYLEFMEVADTYPEEAKMYYDQAFGPSACSSYRDGQFHYRNYDWNFDSSCVFVVSTLAGPGRLASVGVGGVGTNLTEEIVSSGERTKWYKAVPGHMLDGVNEKGVCVNINVISSHGHTNGWHGVPAVDGIHCLAAVRWVLDNATNAQHAATELAKRVYVPQAALDKGYSFHYMISDEDSTWIVEDGQCRSYPGRIAMTNVRSLDANDPCGTGRERLAILNDGGSITDVWFTKAYTDEANKRLSEFVVTGTETEEELTAAWQAAHDYWVTKPKEEHRNERPGGESWWQTVHTAVYDIANRSVKVCVQEDANWYSFQVPATGGSSPSGITENTVTNIVESYKYRLDTSKDWFNLRAFRVYSDAPAFNFIAYRADDVLGKHFHGERSSAFSHIEADILYGFIEDAPKFVLSATGAVFDVTYRVEPVTESWGKEDSHVYSNALVTVSGDGTVTNTYDVTLTFIRDEIVRKSELDNQPVYTSFQDVTNLVRTVLIPRRLLDPAQSNFGIWEFEIGDSLFGSGTVKCTWEKDRWHGSLADPANLDFTVTGVNTNGTYEFEVYEATNDLRIAWAGLGTLETNLTYRSLGIFRVKPVLESLTIGEDEVRALVAAHVPEVDAKADFTLSNAVLVSTIESVSAGYTFVYHGYGEFTLVFADGTVAVAEPYQVYRHVTSFSWNAPNPASFFTLDGTHNLVRSPEGYAVKDFTTNPDGYQLYSSLSNVDRPLAGVLTCPVSITVEE